MVNCRMPKTLGIISWKTKQLGQTHFMCLKGKQIKGRSDLLCNVKISNID